MVAWWRENLVSRRPNNKNTSNIFIQIQIHLSANPRAINNIPSLSLSLSLSFPHFAYKYILLALFLLLIHTHIYIQHFPLRSTYHPFALQSSSYHLFLDPISSAQTFSGNLISFIYCFLI